MKTLKINKSNWTGETTDIMYDQEGDMIRLVIPDWDNDGFTIKKHYDDPDFGGVVWNVYGDRWNDDYVLCTIYQDTETGEVTGMTDFEGVVRTGDNVAVVAAQILFNIV